MGTNPITSITNRVKISGRASGLLLNKPCRGLRVRHTGEGDHSQPEVQDRRVEIAGGLEGERGREN